MKGVLHRKNKDGTIRFYLRATGQRLEGSDWDDPRLLRSYADATDQDVKPIARATQGSLALLIDEYAGPPKSADGASPAFRALAETTQEQRRRVLGKVREKAGHVKARAITKEHIAGDVAACSPHAGANRLKAWRGLMGWAKKSGRLSTDPSKDVEKPRAPRSRGFVPWSLDEIEDYREHHAVGTDARLAMELCYWTASASADAVRLSRTMIGRDGLLRFERKKTGTPALLFFMSLPDWAREDLGADHAMLMACIQAMPAGRMLFLETAQGRPRSAKAFGAWLATHARAAGLPEGRSPHGLRKARAQRLAEAGFSDMARLEWLGQKDAGEAVSYAREADAKRVLLHGDFGTRQRKRSNREDK
ncbi:MAG: tyrosine-type recombinase/integrase [Pseudomonadota bacterium]